MNPSRRVVLVLGMHRSGTSALAGLIGLLGAKLGTHLVPAQAGVNPKGFWEHAGIVALDDRLLAALGSSWHDPRNLPDRWWELSQFEGFRQEFVRILREDFGADGPWAIKDPRLCRLLPLWRPLLEAEGLALGVVLILRHPDEVAQSLEHRDGMARYRSNLLWLQHVCAAERASRGLPRAVVTYAELLADWRGAVDRVATALALEFPVRTSVVERQADEFIETSMRHHVDGVVAQDRFSQRALECYQIMTAAGGEPSLAAMDAMAAAVAQLAADAAPPLAEVAGLISERDAAGEEVRRMQAAARVLEDEINRVKHTVSWRVTGPLRAAWNTLRKLLPS